MVLLDGQDEIKETRLPWKSSKEALSSTTRKMRLSGRGPSRLRERLAKYYATEGSHDRVVIELAAGRLHSTVHRPGTGTRCMHRRIRRWPIRRFDIDGLSHTGS